MRSTVNRRDDCCFPAGVRCGGEARNPKAHRPDGYGHPERTRQTGGYDLFVSAESTFHWGRSTDQENRKHRRRFHVYTGQVR